MGNVFDAFGLSFEALPGVASSTARRLGVPPALRLSAPEAGWIRCAIDTPEADFPHLCLSDVFPPLARLWLWSNAIAWQLGPVTVDIDEEGTRVYWCAEPLPDDALRLTLRRVSDWDDRPVLRNIVWEEDRGAFLARWGEMWQRYCDDASLPWIEWNRFENLALPEPMRDMPWDALADVPALEPPPWARESRIAWFYLQMAYHLRSRGHGCEYLDDPGGYTLRELAFAWLAIRAARAALGHLAIEGEIPGWNEASASIERADDLALDAAETGRRGHIPELHQAHYDAQLAALGVIGRAADVCLPHLPFAPGSFIADERGRRARILRIRGSEWLLYWEDGLIGFADPFYAWDRPVWRWPVAHGPDFDPEALNPIDRRRLRFLELGASPLGIVCPVCGYPCMDYDSDDVSSCDICGFESLWMDVHRRLPALDATVDDEGDPISPTLRERRAFFLEHGDAWPADYVDEPDHIVCVDHLRYPERRRMARECKAEWDDWLEHPDPENTPEAVWRRWNRWRTEQRKHGGGADA